MPPDSPALQGGTRRRPRAARSLFGQYSTRRVYSQGGDRTARLRVTSGRRPLERAEAARPGINWHRRPRPV